MLMGYQQYKYIEGSFVWEDVLPEFITVAQLTEEDYQQNSNSEGEHSNEGETSSDGNGEVSSEEENPLGEEEPSQEEEIPEGPILPETITRTFIATKTDYFYLVDYAVKYIEYQGENIYDTYASELVLNDQNNTDIVSTVYKNDFLAISFDEVSGRYKRITTKTKVRTFTLDTETENPLYIYNEINAPDENTDVVGDWGKDNSYNFIYDENNNKCSLVLKYIEDEIEFSITKNFPTTAFTLTIPYRIEDNNEVYLYTDINSDNYFHFILDDNIGAQQTLNFYFIINNIALEYTLPSTKPSLTFTPLSYQQAIYELVNNNLAENDIQETEAAQQIPLFIINSACSGFKRMNVSNNEDENGVNGTGTLKFIAAENFANIQGLSIEVQRNGIRDDTITTNLSEANINNLISNNGYTVNLNNLLANYYYEIIVTFYNNSIISNSTFSQSFSIPVAKSIVNLFLAGSASGGIAFGGTTTDTGKFLCNYPAIFNKAITVKNTLTVNDSATFSKDLSITGKFKVGGKQMGLYAGDSIKFSGVAFNVAGFMNSSSNWAYFTYCFGRPIYASKISIKDASKNNARLLGLRTVDGWAFSGDKNSPGSYISTSKASVSILNSNSGIVLITLGHPSGSYFYRYKSTTTKITGNTPVTLTGKTGSYLAFYFE